LYTIPAHQGLVSNVRFQPEDGEYLLSSAYDNTVKIWSTRDYQLIKALPGHEGKVMRAEISPDNKFIASCSFDRTWKLWAEEEGAAGRAEERAALLTSESGLSGLPKSEMDEDEDTKSGNAASGTGSAPVKAEEPTDKNVKVKTEGGHAGAVKSETASSGKAAGISLAKPKSASKGGGRMQIDDDD